MLNKIQLGERMEALYKSNEYKALKQIVQSKIETYKNMIASGVDRDEYWELVGKIKGLKTVEISIKKAIKDKNNELAKHNKE